ncbi:hypothetical protein GCM10028824_13030 [Hymenobacter segetis]|uniref:Transposase n=1 Tax=Hymenobacter segetis TaxID=2025509 RepID=A0ABU9M1N8_9BACT
MKNTAHRLPHKLAGHTQANLTGLSAKYVRKLEKPLANILRKLSRKFTKLLDKYSEARNRKARKATREAARFLVKRLYKTFERRGAGLALRSA